MSHRHLLKILRVKYMEQITLAVRFLTIINIIYCNTLLFF